MKIAVFESDRCRMVVNKVLNHQISQTPKTYIAMVFELCMPHLGYVHISNLDTIIKTDRGHELRQSEFVTNS